MFSSIDALCVWLFITVIYSVGALTNSQRVVKASCFALNLFYAVSITVVCLVLRKYLNCSVCIFPLRIYYILLCLRTILFYLVASTTTGFGSCVVILMFGLTGQIILWLRFPCKVVSFSCAIVLKGLRKRHGLDLPEIPLTLVGIILALNLIWWYMFGVWSPFSFNLIYDDFSCVTFYAWWVLQFLSYVWELAHWSELFSLKACPHFETK